MTKVTMPEPVAHCAFADNGNIRMWSRHLKDAVEADLPEPLHQLITTDQAEAYKDACVREALEEAANAVSDPVYIEAAIENFAWVNHGNYVRAHHILRDAVEAIRALIPTTK